MLLEIFRIQLFFQESEDSLKNLKNNMNLSERMHSTMPLGWLLTYLLQLVWSLRSIHLERQFYDHSDGNLLMMGTKVFRLVGNL